MQRVIVTYATEGRDSHGQPDPSYGMINARDVNEALARIAATAMYGKRFTIVHVAAGMDMPI